MPKPKKGKPHEKTIIRRIIEYVYKKDEDVIRPLPNNGEQICHEANLFTVSEDQYHESLGFPKNKPVPLDSDNNCELALIKERSLRAFEMVLDLRKFEIQMYWARATYFWAFIASAFVAYVTAIEKGHHDLAFIISCVGVVLSCAWHCINLGSKSWQRHWEKHLDLLEDPFVGPLYKTVHYKKTYSVSKINEIISFTFCLLWIGLGTKTLFENLLCLSCSFSSIWSLKSMLIIIPTIILFFVLVAMHFGHGRGRFGKQNAAMYRRTFKYDHEDHES